MIRLARIYFLIINLLVAFTIMEVRGQELNVKLGDKHIIKSVVLNEDREVLIHLPENYDKSNKTYPVLYLLDGHIYQLLEVVGITNRLTYVDEIAPELIIVSIVNIDRNSNMWPVNTKYYPEPAIPGAESFLCFIGEELIPYIDRKFRTNGERTICGQSLTGMFVLYALLQKPELFDSYLAASAGFPACEEYFTSLTASALQHPDQFVGKRIFITNGLKDQLDPEGVLHQQMIDFSALLSRRLENRTTIKYLTYEGEGHVPFYSYYDGLKFIYEPGIIQ